MAFTTQYRPVLDGGVPRSITGKAREAISGGQLVFCSGAAGQVNISGLTGFTSADVEFAVSASGLLFTGIAMHNAGSDSYLSVATKGTFIIGAETTVEAGYLVETAGVDGVRNLSTTDNGIGRALTSAGSEGYAVVQIGV